MRKYIIIKFVLLSFLGFSQDQISMPNIVVPSPQAAEISKYGDLNINESSGNFNHSILLGNYEIGTIKVPISLDYAGNGIKVEQNPTWTGMSWTLNAGGVITRTVRDLPDETEFPYRNYSYNQILSWVNSGVMVPGISSDSEYNGFLQTNNFYDSEVDLFSFNFLGYSGTFYLLNYNGTFIPKLTNYNHELKIDIIGDFSAPNGFTDYGQQSSNNPHYEFRITLPDGTKCYFGGVTTNQVGLGNTEAVEETQLIEPNVQHNTMRVKTAFYLNKIENINGDIVYFLYDNIANYNVFYNKKQNIGNFFHRDLDNTCPVGNNINENIQSLTIRNKVYNGKFISKIWSPQSNKEVNFLSSTILGQNGFKYKVLQQINFNGESHNLAYYPALNDLFSGNYDKFFLTELKKTNFSGNGQNSHNYSFEYQDLNDIPDYDSFSQDYLGNYNGKSNQTLLPDNANRFFEQYTKMMYPNLTNSMIDGINLKADFGFKSQFLSDREPVFLKATNGILKKINYPTGGYTEIEYEPVDKAPTYINEGLHVSFFSQNLSAYSIMADIANINPLSLNSNGTVNPVNPYLPEEQRVKFKLTLTGNHPGGTQNLDYRDFVRVEIKNLTTNEVFSQNLHLDAEVIMNPTGNSSQESIEFYYTINKYDQYQIKLGFGDNNNGINNFIQSPTTNLLSAELQGSLSFKYQDGYDPNEGLGIRVKRLKDYTSTTDTEPNFKRYYYGTINQLEDIGKQSYYPLFYDFSYNFENGDYPYQNVIHTECYSLFTNIFLNSSCTNYYLPETNLNKIKNIIISRGGDNFEKGGIFKEFLDRNDSPQFMISEYYSGGHLIGLNFNQLNNKKTNTDLLDGLLLSEKTFKNENEVFKILTENRYYYHYDLTTSLSNIEVIDNFEHPAISPGYYLGFYDINTYKPVLNRKIEGSFVNGISFNDYYINNPNSENLIEDLPNYANFNSLYSITDFYYDYYPNAFFANMPPHIRTTKSNGDIIDIKNYYPTSYSISQLNGSLTQLEITALNTLESQHRIEKPFYTEEYINGVKTKTSKMVYQLFNGIYQPCKIQSSKGDNPLEDIVFINKFDTNNNPVEIMNAEGVKTVYIWSENRKLLYKIVNSDIITVNGVLSGQGLLTNGIYTQGTVAQNQAVIQNLPQAQVTCISYNYQELVTNVMQPNGDYQTYEYDGFNRLRYVKDKDGNILYENEIHYRTDN